VRHDVTEHGAADELMTKATRLAGAPPDILINNAGIHLKKFAVDTTSEEFLKVLNTHVLGAHALRAPFCPE
jgi:gluconate 5-dehydrogenase